MNAPLVECVPNFSEGVDRPRVEAIVAAMRVEGVRLLDLSSDAEQNRSVVTIAGPPEAVLEAAVRGVGKAVELIDLSRQRGSHPRIGAADVIPFVPVSGMRLEQCALLARQTGFEIWCRFGVPVYFYEAAAARPDRASLDDLRQGQFEGLRDAVGKDPSRRPDLGGPELHPTAGACAVGARKFLVSLNVWFESKDVALARAIAREVRTSASGLRSVKAIGMLAHGRAQLVLNISDFEATPVSRVFGKIGQLAQRYKTGIAGAEIVGLIPEAACERESDWMRLLLEFDPQTGILERQIANPLVWPGTP